MKANMLNKLFNKAELNGTYSKYQLKYYLFFVLFLSLLILFRLLASNREETTRNFSQLFEDDDIFL